MYESTFRQQWDPLDWCYGDFLYGDPKLDEEPYKQQDYKQYVKQCLLREELEYDTYVCETTKRRSTGSTTGSMTQMWQTCYTKLSERNAVNGVSPSRMLIRLSSA